MTSVSKHPARGFVKLKKNGWVGQDLTRICVLFRKFNCKGGGGGGVGLANSSFSRIFFNLTRPLNVF